MTAYNSIADAEIISGKPVTQSLLQRLRDNILAMFQGDPTAPKISWAAFSVIPGQNMYSHTAAGTYSLVVPAGVTAIHFDITGPGGYGMNPSSYPGSTQTYAGGGAGEHRLALLTVAPGETLTIIVGAAGYYTGASVPITTGTPTQVKRGATVLMQANAGADQYAPGSNIQAPGSGGTSGSGGIGFPGEYGWTQVGPGESSTGIQGFTQGGRPHGGNAVSNGAQLQPGLVIARY
jgi:hypothetical protein